MWCVPYRHITEVSGFWKEVCSSLAGTAKSVLVQECRDHSSGPPVSEQDQPRPGPAVE